MSYCRWSTDDFACDLYCYESAAEYVTHVKSGATFIDGDLAGFKARLLSLRAEGYRFPDYVLETVDGEIADGAKEVKR